MPEKILVIDDEKYICDAIAHILKTDFAVTTASNGEEGLKIAGAGKYSGSGTMKAALSATHNGVVPLAIAVDFKNWEVPDGLNVKGGTALSGLPKTAAKIDPPGLTGTVVSLEGIAGQTMNAELDLAVSNNVPLTWLEASAAPQNPPKLSKPQPNRKKHV